MKRDGRASPYDDAVFFDAYAAMSRSREGLRAAGEWPQLEALFPEVRGKSVLDLGCGYGWHCEYAAQRGAAAVLGIDGSARMLERARREHSRAGIVYQNCDIEAFSYPEAAYDLVLSNLALHYVADLEAVFRQVFRALRPGGCFLFNIEHPCFTAGVRQEWVRDEAGRALYWPVDDYFFPGARETVFLGRTVVKRHHTLTQILAPLLQTGFALEAVEEVVPPAEMRALPGMEEEMRRPMMLLVKAGKRK